MGNKVDSVTFLPGGPEIIEGHDGRRLNRWRPRDFAPAAGSARPFLDHIAYLFDGDGTAIGFVLDWLAHLVQKPAVKLSSTLLLTGGQGTGKNALADMVAELVGRHNAVTINASDLYSNFNDWICQAHLVVVEEMACTGDRAATARLKSYVTAGEVLVNPKGLPAYRSANHANFILLSNDDDAASLDPGDRRYFVWRSKAQPRPSRYYARLKAWFSAGGAARVLGYLQSRDLSRFDPYARPPATAAREDLITQGRPAAVTFMTDALMAGDAPFRHDLLVINEVIDYMRERHNLRVTTKQVGLVLRQAGAVELGQKRVGGAKPRVWAVRNPARWKSAGEEEIAAAYRSPWDESAAAVPVASTQPTRFRTVDVDRL